MTGPHPFLDRREFLQNSATGFGSVALAWLLAREGRADSEAERGRTRAGLQTTPRVRRAIHVFSPGGVSQVDTFDYKPALERLHGQKLAPENTQETFFGSPGPLMKSVFRFSRHGECGAWVSELFPHLAQCLDDLTFIRTMVAKSPSHTPACFQMNTGFTASGFPSLGSWLSYGLGTESDSLPAFVVLPDPRGLVNGGVNNWSNGFLPAQHQGTALKTLGDDPVANLHTPNHVPAPARGASLKLLAEMNAEYAQLHPGDSSLRARIHTYELAAKLQSSIPDVLDFSDETAATQQLYGMDVPETAESGKQYLLARRLLERGVRFVQLYNGGALGSPRINWDAHEDVRTNHSEQARLLDRPCAGLLKDLKRRGMLDDTLVIWSSEFGRTPFTEARGPGKGRDHNPQVFTCWLAGGGLKPGLSYGTSDEIGYGPAESPVTIYDLHATILHLFGLDHEQLTFRHNGIPRRLTDVHGHVVRDILA